MDDNRFEEIEKAMRGGSTEIAVRNIFDELSEKLAGHFGEDVRVVAVASDRDGSVKCGFSNATNLASALATMACVITSTIISIEEINVEANDSLEMQGKIPEGLSKEEAIRVGRGRIHQMVSHIMMCVDSVLYDRDKGFDWVAKYCYRTIQCMPGIDDDTAMKLVFSILVGVYGSEDAGGGADGNKGKR